jgi:uncharacterized membrane protein
MQKRSPIHTLLQKALVFAIIIESALIQAVFAALESPIKSRTIQEAINNIAKGVETIAWYTAPIFIVVAGIQFLLAGENETKISQAKKTLWWTLIGTAIVVGASKLTSAVFNTAQSL